MAFIKCPQCGQTVLSVASTCPKCSYLLLQAPTPQGDERDFAHCRRCGKTIPRMAPTCEYCAYPQLSRRRIRRVLVAASAICVVIAAFVGVRAISHPDSTPLFPRSEASRQPSVGAEPLAQPDDPASDSLPMAPSVAAQLEARPAPPSPTSDTVREPSIIRVRWTVNWANVRRGPGTDQPIVGVLRPNVRVTVTEMRRGWWLISIDGEEMGYLARDLLTDEPPVP